MISCLSRRALQALPTGGGRHRPPASQQRQRPRADRGTLARSTHRRPPGAYQRSTATNPSKARTSEARSQKLLSVGSCPWARGQLTASTNTAHLPLKAPVPTCLPPNLLTKEICRSRTACRLRRCTATAPACGREKPQRRRQVSAGHIRQGYRLSVLETREATSPTSAQTDEALWHSSAGTRGLFGIKAMSLLEGGRGGDQTIGEQTWVAAHCKGMCFPKVFLAGVHVTTCNRGTALFTLHAFLVAWGTATCMQAIRFIAYHAHMHRDCYLLAVLPLPLLGMRRLWQHMLARARLD